MAEDKDSWFVIERSEALGSLLLTNQEGVEVVFLRRRDEGVDLGVGLYGETSPPTRLIFVQGKSTVSPYPAEGMSNVRQQFRVGGGHHSLPTCVFVVNVRDNKAIYGWLAEPIAEGDRATLRFHQNPTVHELNETAVTEIVRRVKAFYDVVPTQLVT